MLWGLEELHMLRVEHERWGQQLSDLRQSALSAEHERTRERFLALYEIASGISATAVARKTGRNHQTVHEWVKRYNAEGPTTLAYEHTGGRSPLLSAIISRRFERT